MGATVSTVEQLFDKSNYSIRVKNYRKEDVDGLFTFNNPALKST